jgi:hypothetical protein
MKLTNHEGLRAGRWMKWLLMVVGLMMISDVSRAQGISTTTVQGTVYLANGQPGTGTLVVSWPSFTTAAGQLITADSTTVTIAPDGFVSVNLTANQGATPAGLYYTAVFYMSDGTTHTQYWVVPAAAQATLAQVQAQLMPSTQAVQAASVAYVNQALASLAGGQLTVAGDTMTGPLTLCCDPTQPMQAADKHYVDNSVAQAVPLSGGTMTGPLTSVKLGAVYQVDQFTGADFGAKLSACLSGLSSSNGGTCDARNFNGTQSMRSNLTISTANVTVQLPCATISTANQVIVTAGTRNVSLRGCALRGASASSGSQGGTVFLYSGSNAMLQVGDPTYAADTLGFHMDNVVINTTASASATAKGFVAYRTQELDLESLYLLGNSNQTGMTLDGTGNYTGGTFADNEISGFQTAVNAIGHQIATPAITDWMNASTFLRLHIDCPTNAGNPISGTYGINLQQGDGNTFTGGDVEGCSTALHLGANAQSNTIVGLRNENSTNQAVADAGSSYNSWLSGGTIFTGQLTDNGTRNSFLDTFHRSFNGLNGDWYGSQKDATITNHYRLGIGAGNERGLLNEVQTDYGYRWLEGYSDATAGEQFYQVEDLLNNVNRISIGQYNNGQSSTNNQTVINAAGTGAVVLNGSNNSGTGGVVIGSGGANESTIATISNAGNTQFNGTMLVGGTTQSTGTMTVRNNADSEVDYYLWPGLTTSQKGSYTYKDWNGNSQWYMVKDQYNNWALNSATGGLDSFKAYQSTNSGDTYINSSNASGVVRVNYETGSGTAFNIYGGGSSNLYASFTGEAAIKFPGLAASSGHNCLQIDNSGYITNTGSGCTSGSSNGTVNAGNSGQIAYYSSSGTALSGINTVPISAGGTGSSTTTGALSNLGGAALAGAAFTGPVSVAGTFAAQDISSIGPLYDVTQFGATGNGVTDDTAAIQAAINACSGMSGGILQGTGAGTVEFPGGKTYIISSTLNLYDGCYYVGAPTGGNKMTQIQWAGPAVGTTVSTTGFTSASNVAYPSTTYTAAFPQIVGSTQNRATPYIVTFTGTNSLTASQWVQVTGCTTTTGMSLNRAVGQVASSTGSTVTVAMPEGSILTGTSTDSCTLTTVSVMAAFDAQAHFTATVKALTFANKSGNPAASIDLLFGSRVDTGTLIDGVWTESPTLYGYYFASGGINESFVNGWRADSAGQAGIYFRVSGGDNLGLYNGTVPNGLTNGAGVILDNSACSIGGGGGVMHFNASHVLFEQDSTPATGLAGLVLYQCVTDPQVVQFFIDLDNSNIYNPAVIVSPASDTALELQIINSQATGFSGVPNLTRYNVTGTSGYIPFLSYAPSFNSTALAPSASAPPIQLIGDVNVSQLWQYGIQASALLYSDPLFAALPNATTLFAGQVIAPSSYWKGANGKRYALDVVYQTGTTGTPNSGATTCTGTSGTSILTCTSATDLSAGQQISIGTDTNKRIALVDATNTAAVLVHLQTNLASTYSNATELTFSAPILGPEIQMPTKSSTVPTTLAWSQGDMEQNSGATANGVAAWVNVSAGTPGTWAGIPLGNSSGQIAPSQISSTTGSGNVVLASGIQGTDTNVLSAGTISGTGTPLCTDANGGATTTGCPSIAGATNTPAWLQNLGSGADGSYEWSNTGSCTTSPTHCSTNCTAASPCAITGAEYFATQWQVDAGAYVYENLASAAGLVVHATGACNDYGTILVNGAKSTYAATGVGGGSGGGSGGGTAAGSAGGKSYLSAAQTGPLYINGGTAGAASGGAGGNGSALGTQYQRASANGGAGGYDGLYIGGGAGTAGGSSGGALGYPGGGIVQMCSTINGASGVIDASGGYGMPPSANSTGAGSGGGGGVVILSSQASVSTWPAIYTAGGPGGLVTVPEALGTSGSCTTQPKATLGVTSGALNGSCTVVQAGAGCGSGTNVTFNVVGGGGTLGSGTVNPTWSGGALASCAVTQGTSSGYTAATYTTAGTGGDGGNGWYAEFQKW